MDLAACKQPVAKIMTYYEDKYKLVSGSSLIH